jgi:hypothetical protein
MSQPFTPGLKPFHRIIRQFNPVFNIDAALLLLDNRLKSVLHHGVIPGIYLFQKFIG